MKLCGFDVGLDQPLFLIAGPCVVESRQLQMDVAGELKAICAALGIPFIFKSSYDKANRSSHASFRGPGHGRGPARSSPTCGGSVGVPVLTDVHTEDEIAGGRRGRRRAADARVPVPADRLHPGGRARRQAGQHQEGPVPRARRHEAGRRQGAGPRAAPTTSWSASAARRSATTTSCPTCARSRSCATPAARWCSTRRTRCSCRAGRARRRGGQREFVPVLARAAVAAGVAGVFMETHPEPEKALSDGPNAWPLPRMRELLETLVSSTRGQARGFPETTSR